MTGFPPADAQDLPAPSRRPVAVILVTVIIATVLGVGGAVTWLVYEIFFAGMSRPEGIEIDVAVPLHVDEQQRFEVAVRVRNRSDEARVLDSIDVGEAWLDGVHVERSTPAWLNATSYYGDFVSYDYQRSLPPGSELVVTFTALALGAGDYRGTVDVCVDGPASCLSERLRMIVRETEDG